MAEQLCKNCSHLKSRQARPRATEDDVDSVPTANVVEVIRCEQCKFWNRKHISCEGYAKCNTGESGVRLRRKNDYCSVAQPLTNDDTRKEDEGK